MDYFENIFATTNPSLEGFDFNELQGKLSEDEKDALSRPFTKKEVGAALKRMAPTKAPGLDGFCALFFQRYWDIVGNDISRSMLSVLNGRAMLRDMNQIVISLIPKVKKLKTMKGIRPISLCNTTYNIVSKAISNRIKQVLPHIIDDKQSVFVPKRIITDNVMAAYETFHFMKKRMIRRRSWVVAKLDMSKAYDKVE